MLSPSRRKGKDEKRSVRAGWFQRKAKRSFYQAVMSFRSDRINVRDDYVVEAEDVR
jgi:hypothetical protein